MPLRTKIVLSLITNGSNETRTIRSAHQHTGVTSGDIPELGHASLIAYESKLSPHPAGGLVATRPSPRSAVARGPCRPHSPRYGRSVGRLGAGVLYVAAMAAVVVGVDVVFFRNHFWERLAVNVGIVLVFVALYFRFLRRQ